MVKTQNWGTKYTSEKSARAAHLRKHPGDLHWVQVPKKGADRKDLPPGWTLIENTCAGENGAPRVYKTYRGPNNERARSIPDAWRKHKAGGGAPPKPLSPTASPLSDMQRRPAASGLMQRTQPHAPPHPEQASVDFPMKVPVSSYKVPRPTTPPRDALAVNDLPVETSVDLSMKVPVPPKYYSLEWHTTPPRGALAVNDLVEAKYKAYAGGKMWYPGKIAEVHENGSYTVKFDDGDEDAKVCAKNARLR